MGDEADFTAYVVARWPPLVRSLILLGCAPDRAAASVRDGLARCHASFDRILREEDVDVHVYRVVLETWRASERRAARGGPVPAGPPVPAVVVPDPTGPDPEARRVLLRAVEAALAALPEDQRLALVLRYVAELDTGQVADVLSIPSWEVEAREEEALGLVDVAALHREHL